MVDFDKLLKHKLTPEAYDAYVQRRDQVNSRRDEAGRMTNVTLASTAEYYLNQCQAPSQWGPADCVYDAQLYYVLLPEMIKRLKRQ